MAKPQNVLIGKTRGSVGEATFSSWKGENVLKAKAVNAYSNPTTEQRNNNTKFGVINIFAKSILAFILVGFKAMTAKMTDRNAFSKMNPYSKVVTGTAPNYTVDPAELILAVGPELQGPVESAYKSVDDANTIMVSWVSGTFPIQDGIMYAAAFSNTTGELVASSLGTATIGDEGLFLSSTGIGTGISNHTVHLFYVNPANGKACDSRILSLA